MQRDSNPTQQTYTASQYDGSSLPTARRNVAAKQVETDEFMVRRMTSFSTDLTDGAKLADAALNGNVSASGETINLSIGTLPAGRSITITFDVTIDTPPPGVTLVERLIAGAVKDLKTTVVLVTQNLFQAERLADQVTVMLNGELIEVGTSDKMFNHPEDHRTRAFLSGEMVY